MSAVPAAQKRQSPGYLRDRKPDGTRERARPEGGPGPQRCPASNLAEPSAVARLERPLWFFGTRRRLISGGLRRKRGNRHQLGRFETAALRHQPPKVSDATDPRAPAMKRIIGLLQPLHCSRGLTLSVPRHGPRSSSHARSAGRAGSGCRSAGSDPNCACPAPDGCRHRR